jgi:hypothetical protein
MTAIMVDEDLLLQALKPLADIANAYDNNELDDEARKFWGPSQGMKQNNIDPSRIELYQGRGGKALLTLQDCFTARTLLKVQGLIP